MIYNSDLRIGNLINYSEDGSLCSVLAIDGLGLSVNVIKTQEITWVELDQFEPIPLTPEILEKCGFSNFQKFNSDFDENGLYILHNEVIIHSYKDGKFYYGFLANDDDNLSFGIEIKSVHQLQNLYYALTQTELIVNL